MKKIISLGIASAICALTAVSASAADAKIKLTPSGEVATGKQITIEVTAVSEVNGIQFDIDAAGLKIDSIDSDDSGFTKNSALTRVATMSKRPAGSVICTITATVTAQAGEKVSVTLGDKQGVSTADLPEGKAFELDVKGAVTSDTSSTPTSEPTSSTPTSEPTSSGTASGGDNNPNPDTGVALAVIPAVLAAAGVIVAKKRK